MKATVREDVHGMSPPSSEVLWKRVHDDVGSVDNRVAPQGKALARRNEGTIMCTLQDLSDPNPNVGEG